jgi:2-(1,2-epoxy-1,2-dihydrophenyl)acetyl-CoA isomerase
MTGALARVLAQFEVDDDVGCVVLTGAGGAFCAGGDVKAMAENPRSDGGGAGRAETRRSTIDESIHLQRLNQRATSGRLYEMPKPTIAALPGAAAGAGLSLALACDLRYAAESAVLTTAFCPGRFRRRLRRHVVPHPPGRPRPGSRALLPVAPDHRRRSRAWAS